MSDPTPTPRPENGDALRNKALHAASPLPPQVILERTLSAASEHAPVDEKHRKRAEAMARQLARFLEPRHLNPRISAVLERLPREVVEGDTGEGMAHITARISERIRRAVHFFALPTEAWPRSPLMRMSEAFDLITVPEDATEQERVSAAIERYMNDIIVLAFEQQWQDPPQFVSHDWGHSMRIAEHAINFATALSEEGEGSERFEHSPLIQKMRERYQISAAEVEFILYHAHICHDCGYPHLKGRNKSLHAMDSAELALSDSFVESIATMIQSQNARLDLLRQDMYEAIFYHGADVPQDRFQARIHTDRGTFLTTSANIEHAIAGLTTSGVTPTTRPRTVRRIELAGAQRPEDFARAEAAARAACPSAEVVKLDGSPFFIGRKFDLVQKGDDLAGVEYMHADAGERPLLTLLRIADNMDLTSERLGRVRHHPAYYEVIRRIGRGGAEYQLYAQLEKAYNKKHTDMAPIHERIRAHFGAAVSEAEIIALTTPKEARDWLGTRVVNEVLSREAYASMPSAADVDPADNNTITRERIIESCYEMRSDVLEHQGGCLTIRKIELVNDGGQFNFKLHFDRKLFDELRAITFTEPGYDERKQKLQYTVNVAEYQRWRLEQALISNTVRDAQGQPLPIGIIMVYADNGERILPPADDDTDER